MTGRRTGSLRTYTTYVANKTISLPDEVLPIIDSLDVPFSSWVADQLRRHAAAQSEFSFGEQLVADAAMAGESARTTADRAATGERMERSAPW